MLRDKVWWHKINQQVENAIRTCIPCLSVKGETTPELLKLVCYMRLNDPQQLYNSFTMVVENKLIS